MTTEFTPPAIKPMAYVIVYQGTIGTDGSTPLDPKDANVAIAAQRVSPDYPDADAPSTESLVNPDPADLGQVTVSGDSESGNDWVSFGNFDPGEYQVNYVSGAYGQGPGVYFTIMGDAFGGGYGTAAQFINKTYGYAGQATDLSGYSEYFQGANYWDGSYSMQDVYNITSADNPETDFVTVDTGPISLKLGIGFIGNYGDGGAVTYQLQRIGSLSEPTRIRIQNYDSEVKPLLTASANCLNATSETVWDGSLDYRYLSGGTVAEWSPFDIFGQYDYLSVNGKVVDWIIIEHVSVYDPQSQTTIWVWRFEIWGATAGNDQLIWRGYKYTGTNPVGTYSRDTSVTMGADNLCCLHIESY